MKYNTYNGVRNWVEAYISGCGYDTNEWDINGITRVVWNEYDGDIDAISEDDFSDLLKRFAL